MAEASKLPDASAIDRIADLAAAARGVTIASIKDPTGDFGLPMDIPVGILHGASPQIVDLSRYFESYRERPRRKSGTAETLTLQSLIDLTNRHKTAHSAIFADTDWKKPAILSVIDYHDLDERDEAAPAEAAAPTDAAGDEGESDTPEVGERVTVLFAVGNEAAQPNFGKHRIHYAFPLSEEWKAWVEANEAVMTQAEFALFIEDHIADLGAPTDAERIWLERDFQTTVATPAQLVQLSRGLQVNIDAKVKNVQTLQSGEAQIAFEETHLGADGKPLKVPGIFVLRIAPFFMGEQIDIPVRLRYRPVQGQINWFYSIYQPDKHITARVRADLRKVAEATALPAYEGRPEMSA